MAKTQKIIWTALPKSSDPAAKKVVISVHIAPRLAAGASGGKLEEFPDWLDWPGKAKSFQVSFGGGAPLAAKVVSEPPASAKYWQALFTKTTFVRGRESVSQPVEPVRSYPVARSLQYLRERYTALLKNSPTNPASSKELDGLFGSIGFAGLDGNDLRQRYLGELDEAVNGQQHAFKFANGSAPGAIDMVALERFYRRGSAKIVTPVAPTIDFHQMLAAANGHPRLLRLLGLVIDLEVDGFTFKSPLSTDIRVIPTWTSSLGAGSVDVTPRTRCLLEEELFVATPADPGEYSRGQLRLGDPTRFNLVQVDPDGSGVKLLGFAANLIQARLKPSEDTPTAYTVPALRGAGLSVARTDRGVQFAQALTSGGNLNNEVQSATSAGPHPFLGLEEITRGWYVDVWDAASGKWHSLSRRTGAMNFTSLKEEVPVPPTDEAPVTSLPTQSADPSQPKDFYLQESLFFWKGWSLGAAQPGYQLLANDTAGEPPESPPPFPLQFRYKAAPGSLPRLRFGEEYRVRMRAADLAGNSVPLALAAAPGDPNLVAAIHFERFEPVQSPAVVPRAPSTLGESMLRLVIRSNYNADPTKDDERFIVPARSSQRMAEFHGAFDVVSGGHSIVNPNSYELIVSRESKTIPGTQDPKGPKGSLYTPTLTSTPYLPDVLARGAALQNLPGSSGVITFDFTGGVGPAAWPNYKPFRVIIRQPPHPHQLGPPGPPVKGSDATGPFLEVQLPKADVVQVRLSSTLLAGDLALLGLWAWAGGAIPAVQAESGEVWMLTPFQTLTLVHAVRQPLLTPEFNSPGVGREVGETFAQIGDVMDFSRKSTGKVEVYASWSEPVDEGPGKPTPFLRTIDHTLAFPCDLDRSFTGGPLEELHFDLSEQHHFYDTKHRSITYSAVATSKFEEYFEPKEGPFTRETAPPPEGHGPKTLQIPSSARPPAPGVLYVVPTFTWSEPVGPKSTRLGGGLRVYLERPWFATGAGELLGVVLWSGGPEGDPPDHLTPYVTDWGQDPLFLSASLPSRHPTLASFPLSPASQHGSGLSLEELPGLTVDVAGHTVDLVANFDSTRGLWFCDIDVDVGNAYTPFIRLALARFQPSSVNNSSGEVSLSRVVLAQYMQLAPNRSASLVVNASASALTVTVTGPTYFEIADQQGVGELRATLQERDTQIGNELGWNNLQQVTVGGSLGKEGVATWTATLKLPARPTPGRFRVLLEQFEILPTDGTATVPVTQPRITYTDIVPV
jgi:hypothetical protein